MPDSLDMWQSNFMFYPECICGKTLVFNCFIQKCRGNLVSPKHCRVLGVSACVSVMWAWPISERGGNNGHPILETPFLETRKGAFSARFGSVRCGARPLLAPWAADGAASRR